VDAIWRVPPVITIGDAMRDVRCARTIDPYGLP
jgi:hypothetical protein